MTTKLTINNPSLKDSIRLLRFIGPLFTERFREEGIKTLVELRDLVQSQSRAQNIRLLHKVLLNLRPQVCVGEPKYIKDPPKGLKPGYYKYCVRTVNRAAWFAVITYLKRRGVSSDKLPGSDPPRGVREICAKNQKCVAPRPRVISVDKPINPLEHAINILLKSQTPLTGKEIYKESGLVNEYNTMISVLRMNSDNRGRKIFKTISTNNVIKWDLKARKKLANFNDKELYDYIRKL